MTTLEFQCGPERSLGSEKKNRKKKRAPSRSKDNYNQSETEQVKPPKKYPSVEEIMLENSQKEQCAKEYMVTNNRNWGKMSAMMLAAETEDRHIIAHDLCWEVIGYVWKNGRPRLQRQVTSLAAN